jgi:hypothetical protein
MPLTLTLDCAGRLYTVAEECREPSRTRDDFNRFGIWSVSRLNIALNYA